MRALLCEKASDEYGGARALSASVCRQVTLSSPDVCALLRHHGACAPFLEVFTTHSASRPALWPAGERPRALQPHEEGT